MIAGGRSLSPAKAVGAGLAPPASRGRGRPKGRPYVAALLLALLPPALAAAADVSIATTAEPAEAHVGDEITVTFALSFPPGSEYEPLQGVRFEGLELKRHEPAVERKDEEGRVVGVAYRYVVAGFEVGEFTVPAIEARVLPPGAAEAEVARGAPRTVRIVSVLQEGEKDLRDVQGPVELMERNRPLLYALAALALLAAGALLGRWVARRWRPRGKAALAPAAPPDLRSPEQWAEDELRRVEALGLALKTEDAALKEHAFLTTEVLRGYLGRKFAFPSLELTTEELAAELRARGELHADIEAYLVETDFLKFAQARAARSEVQELTARTRALVESVRRREEEARRRYEEARAREAARAAAGGAA